MNYLAHIFLSQDEEKIIIGNFIADAVKGKKYNDYETDIRFGILLHRKIDTFTDSHAIVHNIAKYFRDYYGKYSGAVVDILFDHFLASQWQNYHSEPLPQYAKRIYDLLNKNKHLLPEKMQSYAYFFIKRDRLNCYADEHCLEDVFFKMGKYTSLPEHSEACMKIIKNNYQYFKSKFIEFFNSLIEYSKEIYNVRYEPPQIILNY